MSENLSFQQLMDQLRAGDQDAAREIFDRFAHRLIALARLHLDQQLRQKLDPEDVMQSALKSFFLRQGQFTLTNWESLWTLLVVITLRKCGHKVEHFRAACRDVQREETLSPDNETDRSWEVVAREPTPSHAAILTETVHQVMTQLADEQERQIVELSLQGYRVEEISAQVGRSERTVYRVLSRVNKHLQRLRDG